MIHHLLILGRVWVQLRKRFIPQGIGFIILSDSFIKKAYLHQGLIFAVMITQFAKDSQSQLRIIECLIPIALQEVGLCIYGQKTGEGNEALWIQVEGPVTGSVTKRKSIA